LLLTAVAPGNLLQWATYSNFDRPLQSNRGEETEMPTYDSQIVLGGTINDKAINMDSSVYRAIDKPERIRKHLSIK
jgi:hypothetical protein